MGVHFLFFNICLSEQPLQVLSPASQEVSKSHSLVAVEMNFSLIHAQTFACFFLQL